ncbi:MAG: glycine oxidase ThiO [Magnetococcales bacterium]|nr:glycine oxidase ThiO [Magnetococcales bacterium]NGZ27232.1 glycine oxidase ThiO [Magnetococcales bacterium]
MAETAKCDVLIIGAGVMGCSCALRLLQKGLRVTLLERAVPGAESSAAAAGILGAQSEVAQAGPFLELCLASRALYRSFAQEITQISGVDVGYEDSGVLEVVTEPGEGRIAVSRAEWMMERGLRVEILDRSDARALEPALAEHILGANYYPDDHQVDPDKLGRGLTAAVASLGGSFLSGRTVTGLLSQGEHVSGVATAEGPLYAGAVVMAAGAWTTRLASLPSLRTTIKPMAGQIVQVESRPAFFRHVVYGYKGYIVPRRDGRVLLGSTLEDRGFDKAVTAEGLHRITGMGMSLVPGLAHCRFVTAWSGLRPATADGLPMLGGGPLTGLYFASGHYRNGILLAPVTAEVITDLVVDGHTRHSVAAFSPAG